jgi:hypothetical protein
VSVSWAGLCLAKERKEGQTRVNSAREEALQWTVGLSSDGRRAVGPVGGGWSGGQAVALPVRGDVDCGCLSAGLSHACRGRVTDQSE